MAANAWKAMLPIAEGGEGAPSTLDAIVAALATRTVYVLGSGEDTQSIDLSLIKVLVKGENHYFYDSTDTTTAHDGISVLVDQNGRRYKLTTVRRISSVLDRTATPPGSPTAGAAYLVDTAATGDWAGHDDDLAVYTASGWLYVTPIAGGSVYVEDEEAYYHYTAAGSWLPGLGTLSISADTVTPVEDVFWGGLAVEAVQNAPPGSPTDGQAWLVGTSPSGAFVGHNDEIAYRRSSAWTFLSPYEGAKVWDKATDTVLTYNGTWAEPADIQPVETEIIDLSGASSTDVLDLGDYVAIDVMFQGAGGGVLSMYLSADNGGSFNSSAAAYTNLTSSSSASSMTMSYLSQNSLAAFNTASVKTMLFSSSVFQIETAQVNNAFRVTRSTGTWASGAKLILLKYRG